MRNSGRGSRGSEGRRNSGSEGNKGRDIGEVRGGKLWEGKYCQLGEFRKMRGEAVGQSRRMRGGVVKEIMKGSRGEGHCGKKEREEKEKLGEESRGSVGK